MKTHDDKNIFRVIFIFLALLLMILPLMLAFSDILTKLMEKFMLYKFLQDMIVPLQVSFVGVVVRPFGIDFIPYKNGMLVNGEALIVAWNCVGWQSLLLFLLTLLVGFKSGSYTAFSKLQAIAFGLFGLFWVNVFRIIVIVLLSAFLNRVFRVVFHDYFAAVLTIIYLLFFWWFSYSFILEEKDVNINK